MIPQNCKRLAEVDFPVAEVSKHAAREKSIRHGHPSTLHLWWARRPLASSRAVLLGLLLPDPCDELCPAEFKSQARVALRFLPGLGNIADDDEHLRHALLKFIGDFANWDFASDKKYLDAGRALVHAAHPEETPLVVDPFAGGGSIPLEALRLGCDAFASELESDPAASAQLRLFPDEIDAAPKIKTRKTTRAVNVPDESLRPRREATTLDRVHAAMLLQKSGRTNALRAMLKAEIERAPDFLRLANALSALYPREGEEKRLLYAMLLAAPR